MNRRVRELVLISSAGVTLYSPAGGQQLKGASGNDVLIGGRADTLTGGGGSNTFVFNPSFGKDTIKNFNVSQDVLRFDHTLFSNATASQVLSQTHDSSAGAAVIVVDAANTSMASGSMITSRTTARSSSATTASSGSRGL
jgi:Ca2+-binding RTX toxin-like protein